MTLKEEIQFLKDIVELGYRAEANDGKDHAYDLVIGLLLGKLHVLEIEDEIISLKELGMTFLGKEEEIETAKEER